ncbi:MAG: MBOAT family protein [Planctomycetaceae bacterium]|nr:MBOAT family protein [Planctomycetaceae bacterium]
MVFNSITFGLFFVCVLLLHYLPIPWRYRKFNLLLASYLFYAAWNPPFVILLWISTLVDWQAAKWIGNSPRQSVRRAALFLSLAVNLGFLCFFKYSSFLLENFVALAAAAGIQYQPPVMDILLPVGISFYTFQTLSYTLDIYRGNSRPWKSFLDFALYVTFFPQLVAGPIVRATDFLPQCLTPRRASANELGWGLTLLLLGLLEKTVLADALLAPVVESTFNTANIDTVSAWIGTLAFTGQIFCDFAGYSTCAIGVAMCLGFGLPDNFRFPYSAIGFSDFWRRWHISLSTWLKDYLYIPLGGNRMGTRRTQLNLMLTMLIGGLWHGASWTFIIWGGLHGLYLIAERYLKQTVPARWLFWKTTAGRLMLTAGTFLLVCLTWTVFRAESVSQAAALMQAMLFPDFLGAFLGQSAGLRVVDSDQVLLTLGVMSGMLWTHWVMRDSTLEDLFERVPSLCQACAIAAMLTIIVLMPGEDRAFIYFQF